MALLVNINGMTGQCNKTNKYNTTSQYNRTKLLVNITGQK